MSETSVRRTGIATLLILVPLVMLGCGKPTYLLEGSVFIATQGGTAAKLALVPITAVPAERIRSFLRAELDSGAVARRDLVAEADSLRIALPGARRAFEAAHEAWVAATSSGREMSIKEAELAAAGKILGEMEERIRAADAPPREVPFTSLSQMGPSAKTDADGRFTLSLDRRQEYVIVAWAQRIIGNEVENYRWFIPVTIELSQSRYCALTNDNLCHDATGEALSALLRESP